MRWGCEAMFSDFKTKGFGLEDTKLERADRIARLMLILSVAMHWCVLAAGPLSYFKSMNNPVI